MGADNWEKEHWTPEMKKIARSAGKFKEAGSAKKYPRFQHWHGSQAGVGSGKQFHGEEEEAALPALLKASAQPRPSAKRFATLPRISARAFWIARRQAATTPPINQQQQVPQQHP